MSTEQAGTIVTDVPGNEGDGTIVTDVPGGEEGKAVNPRLAAMAGIKVEREG